MLEDIPLKNSRTIMEMCYKKGFSRDARELSGFRMDRVAELMLEGFDLMAESHRRNDGSFSIKVMKKSRDLNGRLFAYVRIPVFGENPIYYQFGFFNNLDEISSALGIGSKLEVGEFQNVVNVMDYARAEINHYQLIADFQDR